MLTFLLILIGILLVLVAVAAALVVVVWVGYFLLEIVLWIFDELKL